MVMMRTKKDCMQACLSELLGIDYDKIPKFYQIYEQTGKFDYYEWLKDEGYFALRINVENVYENQNNELPFLLTLKKYRCLGIFKKPEKEYGHAAVLEISKFTNHDLQIKILDPKQNTDYTFNDLIAFEFILPLDKYIVNF